VTEQPDHGTRQPDGAGPRGRRPPVGPVDARRTPRYAGLTTYARLPRLQDVGQADIAVLGIPFDAGTSYRPGARFGPNALREGSRLLRTYDPVLDVEPFAQVQVADAGDLPVTPYDIPRAVKEIEDGVGELLTQCQRVVLLGGDHTVAFPSLQALHARWGPIAVIHLDAHLDTWDTYFDAPITHGTPFRRAAEEGLLRDGHCLHLGTRGPIYTAQDLTDDAGLGFARLTADQVAEGEFADTVRMIHERVGGGPVYVSIDVDVLDPAYAPGTGTPEPGGLSTREVLRLLRALSGLQIVGADVVELAPAYDHAQITSLAAAHMVYQLIALFAREEMAGQ
jgi:agmatinase